MTTKNNLIEHVGGIEKVREIVEGAPKGEVYHHFYDPEFHYFAKTSEYFDDAAMIFEDGGWIGVDDGYPHNGRLDKAPYILIEDLRTAIAQYDCDHDWEDISKNGDAERTLICTYCSLTKHDQLSGNSGEFKAGDWIEPIVKDTFSKAMQLTAVYESHMEAGHVELNYGHWKKVDSNTDHITHIENHISPLTVVVNK